MGYYEAEIHYGTVVKNRFIANTVEVLKSKAVPYIEDDKVTQITVSKVEHIGFFKVPNAFEECLKDEIL